MIDYPVIICYQCWDSYISCRCRSGQLIFGTHVLLRLPGTVTAEALAMGKRVVRPDGYGNWIATKWWCFGITVVKKDTDIGCRRKTAKKVNCKGIGSFDLHCCMFTIPSVFLHTNFSLWNSPDCWCFVRVWKRVWIWLLWGLLYVLLSFALWQWKPPLLHAVFSFLRCRTSHPYL